MHGGNLTTTDGQLLVLTTRYEYEAYITAYVLAACYAVSTLNFSIIGADNRPMKTRWSVRSNSTTYYYFTCMVPGNTTFFSKTSYTMVFYNHSDYSDKVVTLENKIWYQNFLSSTYEGTSCPPCLFSSIIIMVVDILALCLHLSISMFFQLLQFW